MFIYTGFYSRSSHLPMSISLHTEQFFTGFEFALARKPQEPKVKSRNVFTMSLR
jgi:hypothetical protein